MSANLDDLVFRQARVEDIARILAFWADAAENDARPSDDAATVEALVLRDAMALEIVVQQERVVGTLISGWDGWRAHLYRLAVHPELRGRGIAGELLRRAEDRLMRLGARRLDAMVLEQNGLGQSFWAAAGFSPQSEWRRWVRSAE
ncbi:GNAT family N-acetyltransferase [Microbacterium sp. Clip185]|uniref:GNAT family N-acetyltransferase n=1 Tax=Microbacterium sp. Clip185 TaxID=3025663 RepID=UPI00236579DC|nr:GNAT family N-acetyltransferase [Microbacterium sp. Clip185]WDG18642.1 GNAT family N-acetyltransferase [Microbacterium sp. Clip185]